ncbi:MAG: HD domain-containing protein [bacterium]|nr:HD domain-containing protein [bacterium]MDT8365227.1 HD domain-containing protein [bacterium]
MKQPGYPLPREDLKDFLQSLFRITGLYMGYIPQGSDLPDIIVGESSFCLQLKTSSEGASKCKSFADSLRLKAMQSGKPEFDLCHARLAEVVIPIVSREGTDFGTVVMGQAAIEGLSDEHKKHIRDIGSEIAPDDIDRLVASAAGIPVFMRSRLETLGSFIQQQLLEKVISHVALEDTTEYLFQKYEELMFLYAITESLSPDSGHQKALAVILDKGVQRLNARWGLFMIFEAEVDGKLELLDACGKLPWPEESGPDPFLLGIIRGCQGPSLILGPGFRDVEVAPNTGDLLVVPFRLRNSREGFLVFGWEKKGMIGDGELKFALALSSQAASVLHAMQLYQELADLLFATLGALSSAVDAKDPYTHGHSQRVAEYAVLAAQGMDFSSKFITMLKIAGQLHDFGKIGVREHILTKQGRLSESEMQAMQEHPSIGAQILGKFKPFVDIVPGIRHHHEHFDGRGYPLGLEGNDIPLVGRIISVADAYDAMTTDRPYRVKLNHGEALAELKNNAGSQFDPEVVGAFIGAIEGSIHG